MQPKQLDGFQYRQPVYDPAQYFAMLQSQVAQQQQTPQMAPQHGNFLTGLAKAIASPFAYFVNTDIVNPIKEISADITHNKVAAKNARLESSREIGLGDNGTDIGKALQKWAGNAAQVGLTMAAPSTKGLTFGKAVGTGALAGAGFGAASAQANNASLEETLKQLALGGALGGVTAGVGNKLFGGSAEKAAPGVLQRTGSKLEDTGGRLMNSQTNLTRAQIRQIGADAPDLFSTMNKNYGLNKLDTIAKISKDVTGEGGVYSEGVKNAIFSGPGIKIGAPDMQDTLTGLLDKHAPLVNQSTRKNLATQLHNSLQTMFSDQPLNPLANAGAAYDVSNSYKAMAADLLRGANVSAADKQLAKVYGGLAKTLDDKLYSQPGVAEALPQVKQSMVSAFQDLASKSAGTERKAFQKLAQEASGINDIQGLRSAQQKWVKMSQLYEKTAQAEGGAATRLAGGGGPLVRMGNAALDSVTPTIGKVTSDLGSAISSIGSRTGKMGGLTDAMVSRGGMLGMYQPTEMKPVQQSQNPLQELALGGDQMGGQSPMGPMGQGGAMQPPKQSMYPMEAMLSDVQRDPKNASTYMSIFKMVDAQENPKQKAPTSPYGKPSAQQYALASRGIGSLQNLAGLINQDPSQIQKTNIPGQGLPVVGGLVQKGAGTSKYHAVANDIATTLLYLSTGAQANKQEIENFNKNYMPQTGDSPQVVQQKLQILQQAFTPFLQGNYDSQTSATPDLQSALMQAQGGYY